MFRTGLVPKRTLVPEPISVLVNEGRIPVGEADLENAQLLERVQFLGLAVAVVVRIDPDPEVGVHGVAGIDDPVPVSAVRRSVKNCQGEEAVGVVARGLRRVVAEQLGEVVDGSVGIAVEGEPAVVPVCVRPAHLLQGPAGEHTKFHAIIQAGQMISLVEGIQHDGGSTSGTIQDTSPAAAFISCSAVAGASRATILAASGGYTRATLHRYSGGRAVEARSNSAAQPCIGVPLKPGLPPAAVPVPMKVQSQLPFPELTL